MGLPLHGVEEPKSRTTSTPHLFLTTSTPDSPSSAEARHRDLLPPRATDTGARDSRSVSPREGQRRVVGVERRRQRQGGGGDHHCHPPHGIVFSKTASVQRFDTQACPRDLLGGAFAPCEQATLPPSPLRPSTSMDFSLLSTTTTSKKASSSLQAQRKRTSKKKEKEEKKSKKKKASTSHGSSTGTLGVVAAGWRVHLHRTHPSTPRLPRHSSVGGAVARVLMEQ